MLVSLQRWTPFYWDQERYGMLVPLLALPVRDPLWNLLVQRALLAFAGLAAIVLAARAVRGPAGTTAGLLGAAVLLLCWPAPWAFEYLASQPYGLSLALGLGALALLEAGGGRSGRGRLAGALALSVAAHWVNAATALVLLPLAALRALVRRGSAPGGEERPAPVRRLGAEAGVLAAGFAAGMLFLRLYPALTGYPLRLATGTLPIAEWPAGWAALLGNTLREAGPWPAVLAVTAAAGALGLLLPAARAEAASTAKSALALAGAGVAYALLTGTLAWVRDNAFHWRYVAPAAVLLHAAAFVLLAAPLAALGRRRPRLGAMVRAGVLAALPAAALLASGAPSPARARANLDRALGTWTEDVLAARCTLVAGDYWSVWPAVFHANLVARERGRDLETYGITHRANPTVARWRDLPREELRICRVRGREAEGDRWLRLFHLGPGPLLERRTTVDVLAPAPDRPPAPVPPRRGERATGGT